MKQTAKLRDVCESICLFLLGEEGRASENIQHFGSFYGRTATIGAKK